MTDRQAKPSGAEPSQLKNGLGFHSLHPQFDSDAARLESSRFTGKSPELDVRVLHISSLVTNVA